VHASGALLDDEGHVAHVHALRLDHRAEEAVGQRGGRDVRIRADGRGAASRGAACEFAATEAHDSRHLLARAEHADGRVHARRLLERQLVTHGRLARDDPCDHRATRRGGDRRRRLVPPPRGEALGRGALSRAAAAQPLVSTLHQLVQRRRPRWLVAVTWPPERQEDGGGLPQPRAVGGGSTREKRLQSAQAEEQA